MGSFFRWVSADEIPEALDLRTRGWSLCSTATVVHSCIEIVPANGLDGPTWSNLLSSYPKEARARTLLYGVNSAADRAMLLHIGIGDALGEEASLAEVEARGRRVMEMARSVPRMRSVAGLGLDLIARDAFHDGKALRLNPREFDLIWRLSDTPGLPVNKETLSRDVWHLRHVPETNSIAVQMSRLRRKLADVGLADIVETSTRGYRLRTPAEVSGPSADGAC